jgi:hypothetical protein
MKRGTNNNQNKELTRGDALVPDTSRGCRAEKAGEIKNYPEEEVEAAAASWAQSAPPAARRAQPAAAAHLPESRAPRRPSPPTRS